MPEDRISYQSIAYILTTTKIKVTLFSRTQQSLIIYLVGRLSVASTTISYLYCFSYAENKRIEFQKKRKS
jgi:hypothetical protein